MFVIFISGPAAAGKYTVGTQVASELDIPLFHNHLTVDLVKCLFEFGSEGFKTLRADIWRSAFREAAREGKNFVFTFHPEATVDPLLIKELSEIVNVLGGSIFFAELTCSTDVVLERLGLVSRHKFGKLTDAELYKSIESNGGFEYDGLPTPDIRIDTESMEPTEAARRIIDAFNAKHKK